MTGQQQSALGEKLEEVEKKVEFAREKVEFARESESKEFNQQKLVRYQYVDPAISAELCLAAVGLTVDEYNRLPQYLKLNKILPDMPEFSETLMRNIRFHYYWRPVEKQSFRSFQPSQQTQLAGDTGKENFNLEKEKDIIQINNDVDPAAVNSISAPASLPDRAAGYNRFKENNFSKLKTPLKGRALQDQMLVQPHRALAGINTRQELEFSYIVTRFLRNENIEKTSVLIDGYGDGQMFKRFADPYLRRAFRTFYLNKIVVLPDTPGLIAALIKLYGLKFNFNTRLSSVSARSAHSGDSGEMLWLGSNDSFSADNSVDSNAEKTKTRLAGKTASLNRSNESDSENLAEDLNDFGLTTAETYNLLEDLGRDNTVFIHSEPSESQYIQFNQRELAAEGKKE